MIPIIVGFLILAVGVHFRRTHRIPPDAVQVEGLVTSVAAKRTSTTGSSRMLYQPTLDFRDPLTGANTTYTHPGFDTRECRVGDRLALFYSASDRSVKLPLERPLAQQALPFVGAAIAIGIGVVDLLS